MISPMVESGEYIGVSVGYRFSDEAIWPAQIHDCKAAIRWLRANATKYNLAPDASALPELPQAVIWSPCWEQAAMCQNWKANSATI